MKTELQVRQSPRIKKEAADPQKREKKNEASKPARKPAAKKKRATTAYSSLRDDDDDDAFMDDGEDDGDDIFAAEAKSRSKRKNDDYVEDDSDDDLPQPKRLVSENRRPVKARSDEGHLAPPRATSKSTAAKKRKTPVSDLEEDITDDAKQKKPASKKPRAPPNKKGIVPENAEYQSILDSIPTIRPPTPEAEDGKFDFRKHASGAGNAGPPPNPAADVPAGADGCLTGLTFVFTGQLQTIGREEAQALVKQYGGKVTSQPSTKTSYVVLGEAAGPSKIAKIKKVGIKTINEEGLFDLIRKLPAQGGSGKAAEKARDKQKAEEEKVRQQALEMEKEENEQKLQAEKEARKAAAVRGVAPTKPPTAPAAQLWTSKYAPTQPSHICGNKKQVEIMQEWLRNWGKSRKYDFQRRGASGMGGVRAIILSGPPGIGKTTSAHLAAKLEGYDVIESNASDTRSKSLVENGVSDVLDNTSLCGYFAGDGKKIDETRKKIVLIMDEVDGMSAGDRGGVGALAKLCKKTEVPLILICNDRRLPKMKPFDYAAHDIKFIRPSVDQIRSRIMTICHREGLKIPVPVIDSLIEGSGKDIRRIINMISTIKLDQSTMSFDQSKDMTKAWEKHVVLKPWDICQKLLGGDLFGPGSKATLNDKIELYFNDHEFTPLMIQENYLSSKPMSLISGRGLNQRESNLKALEIFDRAAESISDGDLVDRMIHGPQQHWSLMPTHAVFSTVRPSSFVSGQLLRCQFTSWLGNNSKTGKLGRHVREIHSHMRLRCSGDHNEVRQQYLPVLHAHTVRKMGREGKEAVQDIIDLMDGYFLTRDDFDAIDELFLGPDTKIETQAKATFTRTFVLPLLPLPFPPPPHPTPCRNKVSKFRVLTRQRDNTATT